MNTGKPEAAKKLERQRKKKSLRQEQLINSAENIFMANGYENTTLEMIADEVGYTKRTLYRYFKDKEDIFSAVVLRARTILLDMLKLSADCEETGFNKLLSMANAYREYFNEHPRYFEFTRIFETHVYYSHSPAKPKEVGPFAVKCDEVNNRILDLLKDVIETGIDDETLKKVDVSSLNLVFILWGASFGMLQLICMRQNHPEDAYSTSGDELYDDYIKLFSKIFEA